MASVTCLITLCHLYTAITCTDEIILRQVKEHQGPGESPLIFTFIFSNKELIKLLIFTVSAAQSNHHSVECT